MKFLQVIFDLACIHFQYSSINPSEKIICEISQVSSSKYHLKKSLTVYNRAPSGPHESKGLVAWESDHTENDDVYHQVATSFLWPN